MDHSWGRNVVDYGLGDLGITVCSHMLDLPGRVLTNLLTPSSGLPVYFFIPLDTGLVFYLSGNVSRVPGSNFPYGHPVVPDVPL